jgi:hypothetical protein
MGDQINITIIPSQEAIEANNDKIIASVVETRKATLEGLIASNPTINWKIFLEGMSPNDPYVVSDSTKSNEITVVVNRNHPYWNTQLSGTESVRDYFAAMHLRFRCRVAG